MHHCTETFNCIEIIVCKQISYNSFKNEITNKLFTYKSYLDIHLNVYKQMTDAKLLLFHSNTQNHLTVYKKNEPELALNNLQWLMCHKTQPNPRRSTLQ